MRSAGSKLAIQVAMQTEHNVYPIPLTTRQSMINGTAVETPYPTQAIKIKLAPIELNRYFEKRSVKLPANGRKISDVRFIIPATIPAKTLFAPTLLENPAMIGLTNMGLIRKKKLAAKTNLTSFVYKRVFTRPQFLSNRFNHTASILVLKAVI